jgi:hypothetical protein
LYGEVVNAICTDNLRTGTVIQYPKNAGSIPDTIPMNKRIWAMDHEVFPNFFSSTFIDRNSDEIKVFYVHEEVNEIDSFVDFMQKEVLFVVGYNNSKYDDIITNYIIENKERLGNSESYIITDEIFELSKEIIGSQKKGGSIYNNDKLRKLLYSKLYKSLDLMSLMAFDKNYVTLKQACIAMRWHKIQDLPHPFDRPVKIEQVKDILLYNLNDVGATKQLAITVSSEIKMRLSVNNAYNVDVMSKSRSAVGDVLMKKLWSEYTNTPYSKFKNIKTERTSIMLKDCVDKKVFFINNNTKKLEESIKNTIWRPGDKFSKSIIIGNSRYDVLLGGLHSKNPPMIVESSETHKIIDLDFGSYYPSLMINLGIYPEHLSPKFLELFQSIVKQRLEAKAEGNKVVADALKIVINAVYGKLNFDYGWIKDAKASYSVTLNGQLYLLMLIEALEKKGIEIFYANTDGATAKVPINDVTMFYDICKDYGEYFDIPLEYVEYKKCIIRDVNNYSIETMDGKIKEKGVFVRDLDVISTFGSMNYTCSYDKPIVALALHEYFINNKPIKEVIEAHTDVYDFCMAQKIGYQFAAEFHTLNEDKTELKIIPCQKTNRYYVSKTQSKFYKKHKEKGSLNDLCAGYNVELLNDYVEKEIKDYKINYQYYISATQKIIDVLEPKQLELFK